VSTLAALLLAAVLPSASPATPHPPSVECPAWRDEAARLLPALETRLVELVSAARAQQGRATLVPDARLAAVARQHAQAMAHAGQLAHVLPGEPELPARLAAAGVRDWDRVGENIAMGPVVSFSSETASTRARSTHCHDLDSLAAELFAAWDASPGHSRNLRAPEFTHIGSGAVYDVVHERVYVTHDFAHEVTCGYVGAACCAPPEGMGGGVCLQPARCSAGLCLEPAPPPSPTPR
jgi:uncharacterized protein YkwD